MMAADGKEQPSTDDAQLYRHDRQPVISRVGRVGRMNRQRRKTSLVELGNGEILSQ